MKVLSRNVRGLNAPIKQQIVKQCLSTSSFDLVMLQETKLEKDDLASFGK